MDMGNVGDGDGRESGANGLEDGGAVLSWVQASAREVPREEDEVRTSEEGDAWVLVIL